MNELLHKFKLGNDAELLLEKRGGGYEKVATVPIGSQALGVTQSAQGLAIMNGPERAIPASGHGQKLLRSLASATRDISVLAIGDSTGNLVPVDPAATDGEVFFRWAQWLAARYPAWTIQIALWDDTGGVYGTPVVIRTGTNSRTLTIWDCSVTGKKPDYVLGSRYAAAVAALTNVDLLIVNHGHNLAAEADEWLQMHWLELTEQVLLTHPGIGVLIYAQNPEMSTTDNDAKAAAARNLGAGRGFGVVEEWDEFMARGKAASLYVTTDTAGDEKHPSVGIGTVDNPTGTDLKLLALTNHFVGAPVPMEICYSLLSEYGGPNLLVNGDFSTWTTTPGAPDSWTATGATVTKDTTVKYGKQQYSCKVVAAGAAQAYINQDLTSAVRDAVKGSWMCLMVATYVPTGQDDKGSRPALLHTGNSGNNYTVSADGYDGWRWKFLPAKTLTTDSYIRARLFGNTGAVAGTIGYFGEAILRVGRVPRG